MKVWYQDRAITIRYCKKRRDLCAQHLSQIWLLYDKKVNVDAYFSIYVLDIVFSWKSANCNNNKIIKAGVIIYCELPLNSNIYKFKRKLKLKCVLAWTIFPGRTIGITFYHTLQTLMQQSGLLWSVTPLNLYVYVPHIRPRNDPESVPVYENRAIVSPTGRLT